ncbi:MAG: methyl-accepting chemotaxis protein [Gammaproteobacteria bacterium]|nr:methyl-accepting chemotaxis protein [Gammaproteobacteria bacterium]MDH5652418.1 methyl-accepting chemotaxis protein [Gammaproteobacteria bacterium]
MSLKARILLLSLATILLVVIAQTTAGRMTQNEVEERFEEASITGEALLWRLILTNQMDGMESNATALARDRDTRNALQSQDNEALAENVRTTYNLLSASKVLTGLSISDLNGQNLVTIPEELKLGENRLIKKSLETGKVQRGVIFDEQGRPQIAVSFPLLMRGQPIGGATYIRDLQDAVKQMKNSNESEIVILNGNGGVVYSTVDELLAQLDYKLPELGKSKFKPAKHDGKTYAVVTHPVKDFTNEARAHLVTVKDHTESFNKQSRLNWMAVLVTSVIVVAMILILFWYISRSFTKLNAIIRVVKDVATGDLTPDTGKADTNSNDETGQLTKAMAAMLDNLGVMVVEINKTTVMLASSSEELTAISKQTNGSIERQLAETAQVATAINELASTAQEVARNAAEAANAADTANKEAQEGAKVSQGLSQAISNQIKETNQVADSLHRLQDQTDKIANIMAVINDIAEQTNLLALNAAIEAARAGEQGRGFAVVADEVRTLATRTQQSTKEIEETVAGLQSETNKTVAIMKTTQEEAGKTQGFVEQTTHRLNGIATSVDNISQMITQIATATEEHTSVTEEIDRNVTNITQLAQQVADDAKHTTTATNELAQLAAQLEALVGQFKTKTA